MPIAGLEPNFQFLPLVARVKKGAPHAGNRPGKNLDYFRFAYEDESLRPVVESILAHYNEDGAKPTIIQNIKLLGGEDIDAVFPCWYDKFNQSNQLQARSDGIHIVLQRDKDGVMQPVNIPIDFPDGVKRSDHMKSIHFTQRGYLSFMLEDLYNTTGLLARFQLVVTAWYELPRFMTTLAIANTGAGIQNTAFRLVRKTAMIDKVMGTQRKKVEDCVMELQTMHAAPLMIAAPESRPQITAPMMPVLESGEHSESWTPEFNEIALSIVAWGWDELQQEWVEQHSNPECDGIWNLTEMVEAAIDLKLHFHPTSVTVNEAQDGTLYGLLNWKLQTAALPAIILLKLPPGNHKAGDTLPLSKPYLVTRSKQGRFTATLA